MARKTRPAVVVSRYDPDRPLALVTFAAITSQYRRSRYEISLGKPYFLREESWVNVQSVTQIDPRELGKKIGTLSSEQMRQIREALAYLFEF
jgi:mRNA-degrading endonuclease toxin of MazEF toxin-antitoxin module